MTSLLTGLAGITKELNMQAIAVSKVLVARIMQRKHLHSIVMKRYRETTDLPHKLPVAKNVLDRQFTATGENVAGVPDITY